MPLCCHCAAAVLCCGLCLCAVIFSKGRPCARRLQQHAETEFDRLCQGVKYVSSTAHVIDWQVMSSLEALVAEPVMKVHFPYHQPRLQAAT